MKTFRGNDRQISISFAVTTVASSYSQDPSWEKRTKGIIYSAIFVSIISLNFPPTRIRRFHQCLESRDHI